MHHFSNTEPVLFTERSFLQLMSYSRTNHSSDHTTTSVSGKAPYTFLLNRPVQWGNLQQIQGNFKSSFFLRRFSICLNVKSVHCFTFPYQLSLSETNLNLNYVQKKCAHCITVNLLNAGYWKNCQQKHLKYPHTHKNW